MFLDSVYCAITGVLSSSACLMSRCTGVITGVLSSPACLTAQCTGVITGVLSSPACLTAQCTGVITGVQSSPARFTVLAVTAPVRVEPLFLFADDPRPLVDRSLS